MPITKATRIGVLDQGVLGGRIREIDFLGAAVSAVVTGDRAEVSVTSGSGVFLVSTHEADLGSTPVRSGRFNITGLSGLTPGNGVLIQQADGPYTGKGSLADEAQMDRIFPIAKCLDADTIHVEWVSFTQVHGNFKFDYAP